MSDALFLYFRISATFSCFMHLQRYPMDNQTCHIQMESCKYLVMGAKSKTTVALGLSNNGNCPPSTKFRGVFFIICPHVLVHFGAFEFHHKESGPFHVLSGVL